MPARKIHVAIIWHMHQPVYKDSRTGVYLLPWVRLHSAKDYADMPEILREFPDVKVTFNLVPCLLEQIREYSEGSVRELFLEISRKPAEQLSKEEKLFLLRNFFTAHRKNAIARYPLYDRLHRKMLSLRDEISRGRGVNKFTNREFLNLQTLFNLVWTDPSYLDEPDVRHIAQKT
ncbi:MAG: glycoside hydrolase, partial [Candidatus Eisenbacteria bacterium]